MVQSISLLSLRWYYGDLPAPRAEELLKACGRIGAFLVRARASVASQWALSILSEPNTVNHVAIHFKVGTTAPLFQFLVFVLVCKCSSFF